MQRERVNRKVWKLYQSLCTHRVAGEDIDYILAGAESVGKPQSDILRDWFSGAMTRLEERVEPTPRQAIRESCACCTTGKRHETAERVFRENATVEARLAAIGRESNVVGHDAVRLPDGRIRVRFAASAADLVCPCLPVGEKPMPLTYCMCCGGHIKHHLQTALGVNLSCQVVSSLLCSAGQETCAFDYTEIP